jgi:hypothetical protein
MSSAGADDQPIVGRSHDENPSRQPMLKPLVDFKLRPVCFEMQKWWGAKQL